MGKPKKKTPLKPTVFRGKPKPKAVGAAKPAQGKALPKRLRKPLKVVTTIREMKKLVREQKARRRDIVFVPTMGYLHEGHLSLMREARRFGKFVVVSIFVNPTQFGPNEDLDRYPRDMAGDRRKVAMEGVDVLFAPEAAEMYPDGYQTYVDVTQITRDFCGAKRSDHFRGVATVVAKLFHIVEPDVALFGEKDYQQLITIQRMVKDLSLNIRVVGLPTRREEDGLAMSSRNTFLSPAQRQQALVLYRGLRKAKKLCESGERDSAELTAVVMDLLREESELKTEYVAVVDPISLERLPQVETEAVLLVAASVGNTRLIDNILLDTRKRS